MATTTTATMATTTTTTTATAPDAATIKEACLKHWHSESENPQLCVLSADTVVKMGSEYLRKDYAWLVYFQQHSLPPHVRVPAPRGPLLEDAAERCYVPMERMHGKTIEQYLADEGTMSDALADQIADAYLALRAAAGTAAHTDAFVPGLESSWMVGRLFAWDGDGAWWVATVSDVKAALENLARRSKATEAWDLDAEPWVWTHGDLSPTNIIITDEGAIAFVDFTWSGFWPEGYELWALDVSRYDPKFTSALGAALKRKGVEWRERLVENLDRMQIYYARFEHWIRE